MVTHTCLSCNNKLDYYHDVYEITSTDTETKEGLIRSKEVETEKHEGWACAYCDNELQEQIGENLNRQFGQLKYLSRINNILGSATNHSGEVKVEK